MSACKPLIKRRVRQTKTEKLSGVLLISDIANASRAGGGTRCILIFQQALATKESKSEPKGRKYASKVREQER